LKSRLTGRPQQALAAYEWLEQMRTRIWLLYGADIQQFLRDDLVSTSRLPNHTDEPPF
jgi:hypothetical protein